MELNNKVAIITGISKGIGKATAQKLLDKGATVVGWGRHAPDYDHDDLHFIKTDVRDSEAVQQAFEKTQSAVGEEVHILINNAGVGYNATFEEMDEELWHKIFDVNVHGVFYCTKAVLPQMKEQEFGHVINLSSIAGKTGIPEMVAYCGAKHAVRGISQSLFKEVRAYNIKVSCLYPGSTKTHFFDNIEGTDTADFMMSPDTIADTIVSALTTPDNFLMVDWEMRPLITPKYKK